MEKLREGEKEAESRMMELEEALKGSATNCEDLEGSVIALRDSRTRDKALRKSFPRFRVVFLFLALSKLTIAAAMYLEYMLLDEERIKELHQELEDVTAKLQSHDVLVAKRESSIQQSMSQTSNFGAQSISEIM